MISLLLAYTSTHIHTCLSISPQLQERCHNQQCEVELCFMALQEELCLRLHLVSLEA